MIKLCDPKDCTGCEACRSVCPTKAISMKPLGSVLAEIPIIDTQKCIECHACERACPVFHPLPLTPANEAFAAISNNPKINETSASGGASFIIGDLILKEGGVVYGAVSEGRYIFHRRISDPSELNLIQGSKYVRSYVRDCYQEVRRDLKEGKKVVFFGTPCQIGGLKSFLKNTYENLLTVDLICHGTPSQVLLRNHIDDVIGKNSQIDRVSFREGGYVLQLISDGIAVYRNEVWKERFKDPYYTAFAIGCCNMRDSCYHCPYAKSSRVSDITIGDFWGLDKSVRFSRRPSGISVILPISAKGKELTARIQEAMEMVKRPVEEAIQGNSQLRHPSVLTKQGAKFRKLFDKGYSFNKALKLAYWKSLPYHYLRNLLKR